MNSCSKKVLASVQKIYNELRQIVNDFAESVPEAIEIIVETLETMTPEIVILLLIMLCIVAIPCFALA